MHVDLPDGHKRLRGPVFTVLGTFVLVYSTALMLYFSQSLEYLLLTGAGAAMAATADIGARTKGTGRGVALLTGSGVLLSFVAMMLLMVYPDITTAGYVFIVIAGTFIIFRGIHDIQSVRSL